MHTISCCGPSALQSEGVEKNGNCQTCTGVYRMVLQHGHGTKARKEGSHDHKCSWPYAGGVRTNPPIGQKNPLKIRAYMRRSTQFFSLKLLYAHMHLFLTSCILFFPAKRTGKLRIQATPMSCAARPFQLRPFQKLCNRYLKTVSGSRDYNLHTR